MYESSQLINYASQNVQVFLNLTLPFSFFYQFPPTKKKVSDLTYTYIIALLLFWANLMENIDKISTYLQLKRPYFSFHT